MPHCTKCGAVVADNTAFCQSCGAPQSGQNPGPPNAASAKSSLQENTAGALCYILGWITGLIFYFVDKRTYVRFHAAQSIVVFGALNIIGVIILNFFGFNLLTGAWTGASLGASLFHLLQLVEFILWILLMIKAYQGERFRIPIAADFADKIFGKS